MDTNDLYKLKVIAQEQNLTRAAERLYTSQPALSYVLSKLEEEMGAVLFDRNRNSITLNEKGRIALAYIDRILKESEDMKEALLGAEIPQLRICSSTLASIRYFVSRFLLEHPEINVATSMEKQQDLKRFLFMEKTDIAISTDHFTDKELDCFPFFEERSMLLVPSGHPLSGKKGLSLNDLEGETIYSIRNIGYFGENLESAIKRRHLNIHLRLFDDIIVFYSALKNRNFLFLVNSVACNYLELNPESRLMSLTDRDLRYTCYACSLKKNRVKCAPFLDWIRTFPLSGSPEASGRQSDTEDEVSEDDFLTVL